MPRTRENVTNLEEIPSDSYCGKTGQDEYSQEVWSSIEDNERTPYTRVILSLCSQQ